MVSKNSPLTLIKKVTQRVLTPLITSPPPPPPPEQHTNTVILSLPTRALWYISNTHAEQHRFFFFLSLSLSLSLALSLFFCVFFCVEEKTARKSPKLYAHKCLGFILRPYFQNTISNHLPKNNKNFNTRLSLSPSTLCRPKTAFVRKRRRRWVVVVKTMERPPRRRNTWNRKSSSRRICTRS